MTVLNCVVSEYSDLLIVCSDCFLSCYMNIFCFSLLYLFFFFQAEDGIRDLVRSRGLGDVYKRQDLYTFKVIKDCRALNRSGFVPLNLEGSCPVGRRCRIRQQQSNGLLLP